MEQIQYITNRMHKTSTAPDVETHALRFMIAQNLNNLEEATLSLKRIQQQTYLGKYQSRLVRNFGAVHTKCDLNYCCVLDTSYWSLKVAKNGRQACIWNDVTRERSTRLQIELKKLSGCSSAKLMSYYLTWFVQRVFGKSCYLENAPRMHVWSEKLNSLFQAAY